MGRGGGGSRPSRREGGRGGGGGAGGGSTVAGVVVPCSIAAPAAAAAVGAERRCRGSSRLTLRLGWHSDSGSGVVSFFAGDAAAAHGYADNRSSSTLRLAVTPASKSGPGPGPGPGAKMLHAAEIEPLISVGGITSRGCRASSWLLLSQGGLRGPRLPQQQQPQQPQQQQQPPQQQQKQQHRSSRRSPQPQQQRAAAKLQYEYPGAAKAKPYTHVHGAPRTVGRAGFQSAREAVESTCPPPPRRDGWGSE